MSENQEAKECYFYPYFGENRKPLVHKIVKAELSETPGGSECTDYTATCGDMAIEWSMGTPLPDFFETLQEAVSKGAEPCPICFPNRNNI